MPHDEQSTTPTADQQRRADAARAARETVVRGVAKRAIRRWIPQFDQLWKRDQDILEECLYGALVKTYNPDDPNMPRLDAAAWKLAEEWLYSKETHGWIAKKLPRNSPPSSPRHEKVARALVLVSEHPEWTDAHIAREVGVHRSTLYRWSAYRRAKAQYQAGRGENIRHRARRRT